MTLLFTTSLFVINPQHCIAGGGSYSNSLYSTTITISPITSPVTNPTKAEHTNKENKNKSDLNTYNFINEVLNSLIWAIIGGFIGSLITVLIAKYQQPKLDIIATEEANTDNIYNRPTTTGGRWKFFSLLIHIKLSLPTMGNESIESYTLPSVFVHLQEYQTTNAVKAISITEKKR